MDPIANSTEKVLVDNDARLDEILNRLRGCEGLVEQELEAYRTIDTPSFEDQQAERDFLVSIVIPVYNEEATVARVVSRVAALPLNSELIIVDDCSTDKTREILARVADLPNVQVILKDQKRRCTSHRVRASHWRFRRRSGCRFRIRPARHSTDHPTSYSRRS